MKTEFLPTVGIEKKLREFRLSGMVQTLDVRVKQATEDDVSYLEFLGLLLEDETNKRQDNKRTRLYRGAHLPFEKGIYR